MEAKFKISHFLRNQAKKNPVFLTNGYFDVFNG